MHLREPKLLWVRFTPLQQRIMLWAFLSFFFRILLSLLAVFTAHPVSAGRDGHYYVQISQHGYTEQTLAFYPLYPILIRVFSFIFPSVLAAFLISILAGTLSQLFFSFIILQEKQWFLPNITEQDERNLLDLTNLTFFGFTYAWLHVTITPTTDSLIMLFLILAIYFARKQQILLSSFALLLGGFVKITFIFFIPYFMFLYYQRSRRVLTGVLAFTSAFGTMVQHYLAWRYTGSLLGLEEIQSKYWETGFSFPFTAYFQQESYAYHPLTIMKITLMVMLYAYSLYYVRKTEWVLQGGFLFVFLLMLNPFTFFIYGFDRQAIPILAPFFMLIKVLLNQKSLKSRILILGSIFAIDLVNVVILVFWMGNRTNV